MKSIEEIEYSDEQKESLKSSRKFLKNVTQEELMMLAKEFTDNQILN
ncbi:protein of unknown function [Tenacibaculum sp. 190524A02b]